jgi:hypothetical protein
VRPIAPPPSPAGEPRACPRREFAFAPRFSQGVRLCATFAIAGACAVQADNCRGIETPRPAAESIRSGNPLLAIPLSKLSTTRDRPLFSASRRPSPPVVATAPPPLPPPVLREEPRAPPFTLAGTIIGGKVRIGIFLDQSSKTSTGIGEGERNSGWTLRSVDPRSAVLESDDGRMVTLDLPEPGSTTSTTADAAVPELAANANPGASRERHSKHLNLCEQYCSKKVSRK